eukprot:Colp12_sorted_trinity150504_noHs@30322
MASLWPVMGRIVNVARNLRPYQAKLPLTREATHTSRFMFRAGSTNSSSQSNTPQPSSQGAKSSSNSAQSTTNPPTSVPATSQNAGSSQSTTSPYTITQVGSKLQQTEPKAGMSLEQSMKPTQTSIVQQQKEPDFQRSKEHYAEKQYNRFFDERHNWHKNQGHHKDRTKASTRGQEMQKAIAVSRPPKAGRTKKAERVRERLDTMAEYEEEKTRVAYASSTAKAYDMDLLLQFMQRNRRYSLTQHSSDQDSSSVVHVDMHYENGERTGADAFIFTEEGAFVIFNGSEEQIERLKEDLSRVAKEPHTEDAIDFENVPYRLADQRTAMLSDHIVFDKTMDDMQHMLEKYSFADAMVVSVKLAYWEELLNEFSNRHQHIPSVLMRGEEPPVTRKQTLQMTGELLKMRHSVNLISDWMQPPDFYWDRPSLEEHFVKMTKHLDIPRRLEIMNNRINYLHELADVLNTHLKDSHSTRLEMNIIYLIKIEVAFGLYHIILPSNPVGLLVEPVTSSVIELITSLL